MAAVTATSRSPLVESGTERGSTSQADTQLAVIGEEATRSAAGPATVALAAAMRAAEAPAARTDESDKSGAAKKPQLDPTRARTPTPASSSWLRSSISPFRAFMDSVRRCMIRASAYRAPAASAASTAVEAASNSVMAQGCPIIGHRPCPGPMTREFPQVMADVIELLSDRCLRVFPNTRNADTFVAGDGDTPCRRPGGICTPM